MNFFKRLEVWGEKHHPKWIDIIRIALGLFLCYKGVDFLFNMSELIGLMTTKDNFDSFAYTLGGHFVVFAHIFGGIFLALGLHTRFACLIQIPILLGAIIFLGTSKEMLRPYSELFLSIIVLLLLCYFLIAGNGPWSFKVPPEEKKRSELK